MASFRCLKSKDVVNTNTGADIGGSTTTVYTLANTPVQAGTLSGTIYDGAVAIQDFEVDVDGVFTFTDIDTPTDFVTDGELHLGLGTITLTWNNAPGTNSALVNYTGTPVYQNVTKRLFYVSCNVINRLCNSHSNAYVAAVTVCDQALYV